MEPVSAYKNITPCTGKDADADNYLTFSCKYKQIVSWTLRNWYLSCINNIKLFLAHKVCSPTGVNGQYEVNSVNWEDWMSLMEPTSTPNWTLTLVGSFVWHAFCFILLMPSPSLAVFRWEIMFANNSQLYCLSKKSYKFECLLSPKLEHSKIKHFKL